MRVKDETIPFFHRNGLKHNRMNLYWKREAFNAYSLKKSSWSGGEIKLIVG